MVVGFLAPTVVLHVGGEIGGRGGGGGGEGGGGEGASLFAGMAGLGFIPLPSRGGVQPLDLQRQLPDVVNITINAAVAEASLGQTIVDALTDYNRRSGPLDLQIAV